MSPHKYSTTEAASEQIKTTVEDGQASGADII